MSTRVRWEPRPRNETPDTPAALTPAVEAETVLLLPWIATLTVRNSCSAVVAPERSMSSRVMTVTGNAYAYMLKVVDRVEAPDRYTVKFTLKEPFVWFLDMLAHPMAVAIVAQECVEKFGDLKKAEACVGTGPWMLESYRPKQRRF